MESHAVSNPAFRPPGNSATSITTAPQFWNRITVEHQTLSRGESDIRWLLDESTRLLALSLELQNHSVALSRYLTELRKRLTANTHHDPKPNAFAEIFRSTRALINDARATRQAATLMVPFGRRDHRGPDTDGVIAEPSRRRVVACRSPVVRRRLSFEPQPLSVVTDSDRRIVYRGASR